MPCPSPGPSPSCRCTALAIAVALALLLVLSPGPQARATVFPTLNEAGRWISIALAKMEKGAAEAVDWATGEKLKEDLRREMHAANARLADASDVEHMALEQKIELLRDVYRVLVATLEADREDVEALREEQQVLAGRIDGLETRMTEVAARLDAVDQRVRVVEEAMIAECLDLRDAPTRGAQGYRVSTGDDQQLTDSFRGEDLTVDAHLYLDSCSPELTERGLLIQLRLTTVGLDRDMTLYTTIKDVQAMAAGAGLGANRRFEFPLRRPRPPLDSQVQEIFLPYADLLSTAGGRLALAMVLTHDGRLRYTLPDRVLRCNVGRRTSCRWWR